MRRKGQPSLMTSPEIFHNLGEQSRILEEGLGLDPVLLDLAYTYAISRPIWAYVVLLEEGWSSTVSLACRSPDHC